MEDFNAFFGKPEGFVHGSIAPFDTSAEYASALDDTHGFYQPSEVETAVSSRKQAHTVSEINMMEDTVLPIDEFEEVSVNEQDTTYNIEKLSVYSNYNFERRGKLNPLPIDDSKQKIIKTIRKNCVTIIEGDTGCGKTTQVPQYILDDAYQNNEHCKIVCTQPRRIAAISIAQRVSEERNWPCGSLVGFKVGLHTQMSEDTRILYCTTGVLLQRLIKEKTLTAFTHIILDEVHERDQDMDFLLIIIRKFLSTNSQNVKVVLMSATINTTEFADYFKIHNQSAPVLRINKESNFKVSEFYFNDLARINKNYELSYNEPGISLEMYNITLKLLIVLNNIEKQEIGNQCDGNNNLNSILVFLPGINEIDTMCQKLLELKEISNDEIKLMPIRLHSLIPPDEQSRVFYPVPKGYRKVILATNIAESSITVPDVKFVIDFCLTKCLVTNTGTNFTSLQLHWASRANCRQRAGRAGRVMHGRVYRMVDKSFYESSMLEFCVPEMLRCPLENVVLKAKVLNIGPPISILGLAMSPPNLFDIVNTILTLKEVGALFKFKEGEYVNFDSDLTFIGRVMAAMPLDIRLTRLIILGYVFSCLEDAIIIAAGLSVRGIFKFHINEKGQEIDCHVQKLTWADGSGSDLIAILSAYKKWTAMREQGLKDGIPENSWAKRNFINLRSIKEMHLLVIELKERLLQFGIKEQTSYQRIHWIDREKTLVLKIVIAGAFYPNYFTRSNLNDIERERSIHHTLCGHNPCSTVYFTNFNNRHIGPLYTRSIKDLFRDLRIAPQNIDVHFQPGSQHVFVTFKSDPEDENSNKQNLIVPGKLRPELYKAIRMRMLRMHTSISVMDPTDAIDYAIAQGIGDLVDGVWQPFKHIIKYAELVALPSVVDKTVCGYISHIDSCSQFYFQSLSEMQRLREIDETLNHGDAIKNCKFATPSEIGKGLILAAPFNGKYSRARVLRVITSFNNLKFKVVFIDYGNTAIIEFEKLRYFPRHAEMFEDMPPRSFICRLALIQPSLVKSPHGKWSDEANEILQDISNSGKVEIEVYSVVEGVANVILRMRNGTLNEILVEKGFARHSDESFISKSDHDYRLQKQFVTSRSIDTYQLQQNEEYLRSMQKEFDEDIAPPPTELCKKRITLRGPFSPLETKIFSAVAVGSMKGTIIEAESVNGILLDSDPQDVHEQLIVAASVSETEKRNFLLVHSTTLMPNIHGFGPLMTLLFCPTMQIKTNPSCTNYVSILAGLGYNKSTLAPFYKDHDIVLNLDVQITREDIQLINQLRYNMDSILYTANQDEECPQISSDDKANMMAKIKDLLIKLLNKERKYMETQFDSRENVWEDLSEVDIIKPNINVVYENRSIYPLHSIPNLYDENHNRLHTLRLHCKELYQIANSSASTKDVKCLLCNQTMDNAVYLRIHLLSQLHRDREQNIRFERNTK